MTLIKTHTTSRGNKLEFYQLSEDTMLVIDNSCELVRIYELGTTGELCWDDYDKVRSEKTEIRSFNQVVKAWTNEQIHFF